MSFRMFLVWFVVGNVDLCGDIGGASPFMNVCWKRTPETRGISFKSIVFYEEQSQRININLTQKKSFIDFVQWQLKFVISIAFYIHIYTTY